MAIGRVDIPASGIARVPRPGFSRERVSVLSSESPIIAPDEIEGLVWWLDGRDLAASYANGAPITSWTDRHAGRVFVNGSGSDRPSYSAASEAANFATVAAWLASAAAEVSPTEDFTLVFVCSLNGPVGAFRRMFTVGTNLLAVSGNTPAGQIVAYRDAAGTTSLGVVASTLSRQRTFTFSVADGVKYYESKAHLYSGAYSAQEWDAAFRIGDSFLGASDGIQMVLNTLLAYNRALTANEVSSINDYIRANILETA